MTTMAEKVRDFLEKIDLQDDDGFRKMDWETISQFLKMIGGIWEECHCGSEYCEICNGSHDPSVDVKFSDGSKLHIGNPSQSVFARFYLV